MLISSSSSYSVPIYLGLLVLQVPKDRDEKHRIPEGFCSFQLIKGKEHTERSLRDAETQQHNHTLS